MTPETIFKGSWGFKLCHSRARSSLICLLSPNHSDRAHCSPPLPPPPRAQDPHSLLPPLPSHTGGCLYCLSHGAAREGLNCLSSYCHFSLGQAESRVAAQHQQGQHRPGKQVNPVFLGGTMQAATSKLEGEVEPWNGNGGTLTFQSSRLLLA